MVKKLCLQFVCFLLLLIPPPYVFVFHLYSQHFLNLFFILLYFPFPLFCLLPLSLLSVLLFPLILQLFFFFIYFLIFFFNLHILYSTLFHCLTIILTMCFPEKIQLNSIIKSPQKASPAYTNTKPFPKKKKKKTN